MTYSLKSIIQTFVYVSRYLDMGKCTQNVNMYFHVQCKFRIFVPKVVWKYMKIKMLTVIFNLHNPQ